MPTLAQYLANIGAVVTGQRFPASRNDHSNPLLHVLHELTRPRVAPDNPRGLVIYEPRTPFVTSVWHVVSQQVLTDLNYDDLAAWQAAAGAAGFIHADDLAEVESHVNPLAPSPAIYDPRILRGNATGYREMRVQGFNLTGLELPSGLAVPAGFVPEQVRVALLWRP